MELVEPRDPLRELLDVAREVGIGVTFMPDPDGWTVGYLTDQGGGDLSMAYDLQTAADAAIRPLYALAR